MTDDKPDLPAVPTSAWTPPDLVRAIGDAVGEVFPGGAAARILENLVDRVGSAIGIVYRQTAGAALAPFVARREGLALVETAKAEAEAQRHKASGEASGKRIAANAGIDVRRAEASYARVQALVKKLDEEALETPEGRAFVRVLSTETRYQENLEAILGHATAKIATDPPRETPEEEVSQDWLDSFIEAAKRTSRPEAQEMWGRALASEFTKPGSLSTRALLVLKTVSREEGEAFAKICQVYCRTVGGVIGRPGTFNTPGLGGVTYNDILLAEAAGLVFNPTSNICQLSMGEDMEAGDSGECTFEFSDTWEVWAKNSGPIAILSVPTVPFTSVGKELEPLIARDDPPADYVDFIRSRFGWSGADEAAELRPRA